jgi:hypothetical protein
VHISARKRWSGSVQAAGVDRAAQGGERGLIATDVIGALRGAVNPIGPDRP